MGQVKKPEVREAILKSASRLFARKGYARTTLSEIAADVGVSTANLYVYFRSKLEILYAIYEPWMRERLWALEVRMAGLRSPRDKLRLLLTTLWREIPAEKHGFVNNIMQAISSATPRDRYRPTLLKWMEEHLDAAPAPVPGAPRAPAGDGVRRLHHLSPHQSQGAARRSDGGGGVLDAAGRALTSASPGSGPARR